MLAERCKVVILHQANLADVNSGSSSFMTLATSTPGSPTLASVFRAETHTQFAHNIQGSFQLQSTHDFAWNVVNTRNITQQMVFFTNNVSLESLASSLAFLGLLQEIFLLLSSTTAAGCTDSPQKRGTNCTSPMPCCWNHPTRRTTPRQRATVSARRSG